MTSSSAVWLVGSAADRDATPRPLNGVFAPLFLARRVRVLAWAGAV